MNFIKCPKCGREEPAFDYAHICGPLKIKSKMNERVWGLWQQATLDPTNEDAHHLVEKFAELIVRECADLVDNNDDSYPYVSFGDMIKKHFGVES
jgi:hypothetical protein